MPHVDIAATRRAARQLEQAGDTARGAIATGRATDCADELAGSASLPVLYPLTGALALRLGQVATELEAMARGMQSLADHTSTATGEG